MTSPLKENKTSLPKEFISSWTRAIWVNIVEIALFCTIPIIISPPEAYPYGYQFIGWAVYGIFYISETRYPGMIGDTSGYPITIFLFVITIVFFIFNIAAYYSIVAKKNRAQLSPRGIRRRLKIALYGVAIAWIVPAVEQTLETFEFCPVGNWCFVLIPIYLVILFPWALRVHYSKQVIEGLPGEQPIDEAWAAPVRKAILELGTKYTRLQVNEIAEKVNVKNEKQIVAVVQDMIKREQIAAEYFKSSRTVAFDQQANTQALAKFITDLDGQFTAWGKDGKKT